MGLAWQQGPLATSSVGHLLSPHPLPERLSVRRAVASPDAGALRRALDRRQRGRRAAARTGPLSGRLLSAQHESPTGPGRGRPRHDSASRSRRDELVHRRRRRREAKHAAWQYTALPRTQPCSTGGWRSPGGRWTPSTKKTNASSDTRRTSTIASTSGRHLTPSRGPRRRSGDRRHRTARLPSTNRASRRAGTSRVMTSTSRRCNPIEGQTFCPYKGLASYYAIGDRKRAAWSYVERMARSGTR